MASAAIHTQKKISSRGVIAAGVGLLLLIVAALFSAVPRAQAQGVVGFVEADFLNVRVGPHTFYEPVTVVAQGTPLVLEARTVDGRWALTTVNGQTGWVAVVELSLPGSIAALPVITEFPPIAYVRTGHLNVRSGPGLIYQPIAVVAEDTQIFLIGRSSDNNWVLALIDMNTAGWVATGPIEANVSINSLPLRQAPPAPQTPAQPNGGGGVIVPAPGTTLEPISPLPPAPPVTEPQAEPVPFGVIVGVERLNVRTQPSLNSPVVQTISGGDTVILLARTDGTTHVKVEVFDGTVGWISSSFVAPSTPLIDLPIE